MEKSKMYVNIVVVDFRKELSNDFNVREKRKIILIDK